MIAIRNERIEKMHHKNSMRPSIRPLFSYISNKSYDHNITSADFVDLKSQKSYSFTNPGCHTAVY